MHLLSSAFFLPYTCYVFTLYFWREELQIMGSYSKRWWKPSIHWLSQSYLRSPFNDEVSSVKVSRICGKTSLCCSAGVLGDLLRARTTGDWLSIDSSLPPVEAGTVCRALFVVKSAFCFLYYLVTVQVPYLNKLWLTGDGLWHSWCNGVSWLWDVSHQRWFGYLKKLLFYLSWVVFNVVSWSWLLVLAHFEFLFFHHQLLVNTFYLSVADYNF